MIGRGRPQHASSSSSSSSSAAYEPLLAKDESDTSSETLRSARSSDGTMTAFGKDYESDEVIASSQVKAKSEQSSLQFRWLTALVLITFLLTVLNAVLLIYPNTRPAAGWGDSVNDEPLPTPDAYIGLRKMLRLEGWKDSLKPFYNFPFEVALMDKVRPNDVIPNFRTIAHVNKTVIVPDNRHVVINNYTSTILQFYTLEFGFERCQITFSLPTNHTISPRTPRLGANINTIEVYLLNNPNSRTSISDAVLPLSETLTFATRPERIQLLGGLALPHAATDETGGDWEGSTGSFECKERAIQTVELSCSGNCDVDLWMDKYDEGPRIGPRMMQHPTL